MTPDIYASRGQLDLNSWQLQYDHQPGLQVFLARALLRFVQVHLHGHSEAQDRLG